MRPNHAVHAPIHFLASALVCVALATPREASANPTIATTDTRLTTSAGTLQGNSEALAYNKDLDQYLLVFGTSDKKLWARRYTSAFAAIGADIHIGDTFESPEVAYNPVTREYVVVMVHTTDFDIWGVRIRDDGGFGAPGVKLSTQPDVNLLDLAPRLAIDHETGRVCVVWMADDAGFQQDVVGRVMASDLASGTAQAIYRDATVTNTGVFADVAYAPTQNEFMITYSVSAATRSVRARRVDSATGAAVGAELTLFTAADGTDRALVAYNSVQNEYFVAYLGEADAGEAEVFGRRVSVTGTALGAGPVRLSNGGAGLTAIVSGIAYSSVDDEYVVVWQGDNTVDAAINDEFEVFGQQVDADGTEIGTDFRISFQGPNAGLETPALLADIVYDGDRNRWTAIWHGDTDTGATQDHDVFIKSFTTGTPIVCGNGSISGTEGCDDGDTDSNDGCSSQCNVEPGWSCSGATCLCQANCPLNCAPGAAAGFTTANGGTSALGADSLLAYKVTVASAFTLQQLGVFGAANKGEARAAIYADASGAPGALLGETAAFRVIDGEQLVDVFVDANHDGVREARGIQLPAGVIWVTLLVKPFGPGADATVVASAADGNIVFVNHPFASNFPATFVSGTAFAGKIATFRLKGCNCTPASDGLPGPGCGATASLCGNGQLDGSEVCDDGNITANDGCSADCLLIGANYSCSPVGSACSCTPGFYPAGGGACSACDTTCATCNGAGPNACATCGPTRVLIGSSCVLETVDFQFVSLAATAKKPGEDSTVTATVKNLGNSPKTATVAITIEPGAAPKAGSNPGFTCVPSGPNTVCTTTTASLAASASAAPQLILTVNAAFGGTSIPLSGVVTVAGDSVAGNNTASTSLTIVAVAELSTVVDCPAAASAAVPASCTLTVTNAGPSAASNLSATITPQAALTLSSPAGTGWTCTGTAPATCTRASLPTGNSALTFQLVPTAPVPAGTESASVTGNVTASSSETNATNTSSDTVAVDASASLALTLTTTTPTITAGASGSMNVEVENVGTQHAANVVLTASVPAALTPSGTGWSCNLAAETWTCTRTVNPLNVNGSSTFALALAAVDPTSAGVELVQVDVTATHSRSTPEGGDAAKSITFTVDAKPEVVINTVTQAAGAATPGTSRSYTINIENKGKQDATGVIYEATIPANAIFDDPATTALWTCDATKCTLPHAGKLDAKKTSSAIISFKFDAFLVKDVSTTSFTAKITDDGKNGPQSIDTELVNTALTAQPDVRTTTTSSSTPAPGGNVSVSVTIDNPGNQEAAFVNASVVFEAAASASAAGWSCGAPSAGKVTCTRQISILDLNPVASTFSVTLPTPYTAGVRFFKANTSATDDGTQGTDPVANNNSSQVQLAVTGGGTLAIALGDDGAAAAPGSTITVTATTTAGGNQILQNLVHSFIVPTGTTFQGTAPWSCAAGAAAGTPCTANTALASPGAVLTHTIPLALTAAVPAGALALTVSVTDDAKGVTGAAVTASATHTRTVTRCDRDWTFVTGTGPFVPDANFSYVTLGVPGADKGFKTAGAGNVPSGRFIARLNTTVTVPTVAAGGPKPELEITYRLQGNANPAFNRFVVCLDNPTCTGQSLGLADETGANTAAPGLEVRRVDLRAKAGTTVNVTLVYDTIAESSPGGFPGLSIDRIRLVSNADGDSTADGTYAECDRCWDEDGDTFVHAASPGPCPNLATPDCDDRDNTVKPGGTELCGVPGDEDCNGLADGFDEVACGIEDCANGIDDNQNSLIDCADAVCVGSLDCNECASGFSLDRGFGGFTAQDNDPDETPSTQTFVTGAAGADKGIATVADLDVVNLNRPYIRATLSRTLDVPPGIPAPTLFVRYRLSGVDTVGRDVFGVCINVGANSCNATTPAKDVPFKTDAETTGFATAKIPLAAGAGQIAVTLFYDTVDAVNESDAGVFIDSVTLGSDLDADGIYEAEPAACDHCVDGDADTYGRKGIAAAFVSLCDGVGADCDDAAAATHPGQQENCALAGDNDCDNLGDEDEVNCSACGDGNVSAGEVCDDQNTASNDGCSATCAIEPGALVLTEIHAPFTNGPQWVELFNASKGPLDLLGLGLELERETGARAALATHCATLPGRSTVVPMGGRSVIAVLPSGSTLSGLSADVVCSAPGFELSPTGDLVRVRSAATVLDTVDFRGFDCELGSWTGAKGRSLELQGVPVAATNDAATAWCLAGAGDAAPNQLGSPGLAGTCAELTCDAKDDDCDGTTDEALADGDSDGLCDAVDCDAGAASCTTDCVTNVDNDATPDCKDGCLDQDGDTFGVPGGLPTTTCALVGGVQKLDCNDALSFVNPGATEAGAAACSNGEDDDCDTIPDCAESGCSGLAACAGEACASGVPILCGATIEVEPVTDELPCADGDDAVVTFVAPRTETVVFTLTNVGQRQFGAFVFSGSCTNGSCANPLATTTAACATPGTLSVAVTQGQSYSLVIDAVAACSGQGKGSATLRLACAEVCLAGQDTDADGQVGCEDSDCVLAPACAATDFDGDGATNAIETTCGTNPKAAASQPSTDDVKDTDGDLTLNCADTDDDGDGASDLAELAACTLNSGAKNDDGIYPGADKRCDLAGLDADCNKEFDSAETACGAVESQCGDLQDNDNDLATDCADSNCATSALCGLLDFDGDGVPNRIEILCNTSPTASDDEPPGGSTVDPDSDGAPNCADVDDDGDGVDDVTEALCGSNLNDKTSVPVDTDADQQCDSADPDDDGDGAPDTQEVACGSDPNDSAALPTDAAHNQDTDGVCDLLDTDRDGDDASNGLEVACGTDPENADDEPADHDVDSDGICDRQDEDDDDDGWTDAREQLCGSDPMVAASTPTDTDLDGYCDFLDADTDGDGWPDALEQQCGTSPTSASSNPLAGGADSDVDGLCDAVDPDDDGDGWEDTAEAACGTAPKLPSAKPLDTDGDGACDAVDDDDDDDTWSDANEALCGSKPADSSSTPTDADKDGVCDTVDPEADPDADGWTSFEELGCGTLPEDLTSTPADNDADGTCDPVDDDDDNDGWTDADELACGTSATDGAASPADSDGDGACDTIDADDDGDGSPDVDELLCGGTQLAPGLAPSELDLTDPDLDGVVNCNDDDDDDDVPDAAELSGGTEPLVKDSDGDGLDDGVEDVDHDGVQDDGESSAAKSDSDGDGLDDGVEVGACYADPCVGSSPVLPDTDGDGVSDGDEDANENGAVDAGETAPLEKDSDGDGVQDGEEIGCDTDPLDPQEQPQDLDQNDVCDRAEGDADKDGVADGVEAVCKTSPTSGADVPALTELVDSDGDGQLDCADDDDDEDGVNDPLEIACGTDPKNPGVAPAEAVRGDKDGDGAADCADDDDDDDGLDDATESALGTDPLDADSDDDGLSDGKEVVVLGTSPTNADTDGDGLQDGTEAGVPAALPPGEGTDPAVFVGDTDPSTTTDPVRKDTDQDGVIDGDEDANRNGRLDDGEGDPTNSSDGLLDTDGDGLPDRVEAELGTDPRSPDTDGDGLSDKVEVDATKTDPVDADTDDGGVPDGIEVQAETDPLDGTDDYGTSVASGDNVFGCDGGSTPSRWNGTAIGLALALLALRRRR